MAILDPAAEYIAAQNPGLTDFIFRMTGDRSRAGIVATEVCEHIHRELLSRWSEADIKVELYAHAYERSLDAQRGIEKSFLENYYRHQIADGSLVSLFYPLELFLGDLDRGQVLSALLVYRFHFSSSEVSRILQKPENEVESDLTAVQTRALRSPKIHLDNLARLPAYDFLAIPDGQPTALSHLLINMKTKRFNFGTRLVLSLIVLGLIVGWVVFLYLLRD